VIINGREHNLPVTEQYVKQQFGDVFDGIGKLPGGEYHLRLKPGADPVRHSPRVVPQKRKDAFQKELQRLTDLGVIQPEPEHTQWVNSIVLVDKPDGSVRVCLDPKDLNQALERNPYHSKTVDEIMGELNGAKFFTLVDAAQGYWHVPLDEESSRLCTFNTPWGKYRWNRLPFGLKVSSDVFQERLDAVTRTVQGATGIADDCLAIGSSMEDHDVALLTLLETARLNGIKFNARKMQFRTRSCTFFGQMLTDKGLQIDPKKIAAIQDMAPPRNAAELKSFLGMVNYLKRFSNKLMTLSEPLKDLVKEGYEWEWTQTQEQAFAEIKQEVCRTPVLTYFNPEAAHVIQTDASLRGVGAVLLQEGRPVIFASRSLTETEQRYSNIERELLSVVFGCERLHNFLYGGRITVQTDHKPLETIFKKRVHEASPRLQRLLLRLNRYDIDVEYIKGKNNTVADALSRVDPMKPEAADLESCQVNTLEVDAITASYGHASESRLE
jgi:hypothetical protein